MRPFSLLATLLISPYRAFADENEDESVTGTITATISCATGEVLSKWESCSSSVSSKVDACNKDDVGCACSLAHSGFSCLSDYYRTHTSALCAASLFLRGVCSLAAEPSPTFTEYSHPTSISYLIPSDFQSMVPTDTGSLVPFFGTAARTESKAIEPTGVRMTYSIRAPSNTNAANGGFKGGNRAWGQESDPVNVFLGVGICVAVAAGGLAAIL